MAHAAYGHQKPEGAIKRQQHNLLLAGYWVMCSSNRWAGCSAQVLVIAAVLMLYIYSLCSTQPPRPTLTAGEVCRMTEGFTVADLSVPECVCISCMLLIAGSRHLNHR